MTNTPKMIFDLATAAAVSAIKDEVAVRPEREEDFDCGFAWVTINPATGPLVKYCKEQIKEAGKGLENPAQYRATSNAETLYGSKGYPKGWQFWKPGNFRGQSIRIHLVGARAFAKVLTDNGITCTVGNRLD